MLQNINLVSYLVTCVLYGFLTVLLGVAWRRRPLSALVIAACILTALWGGAVAVATLAEYPPILLIQVAELARNLCWIYLLLSLLKLQADGGVHWLNSRRRNGFFAALGGLACLGIWSADWMPKVFAGVDHPVTIQYATWLGLAFIGVMFIEQIYRNAEEGQRWWIKFLCIGLLIVFGYDFLMYAEALLLQRINPVMWQARGLVVGLSAPLVAVAIVRNREWKSDIHVSRDVVFHSLSLVLAGTYLLLMSFAGYVVKYWGGDWSAVFQITFLIAATALLLLLIVSGSIRAKLRIWLSKNFYSFKFDYRQQWLDFTQALNSGEGDIPQRIVLAVSSLVSSPAGLLWARDVSGAFSPLYHNGVPLDEHADIARLATWMEDSNWVIDLDEWRAQPENYGSLEVPEALASDQKNWLLVPLMLEKNMIGILLLRRSSLMASVDWEERDLLKLASRQAATHLAQYQATKALVEARQFEAFNRLSAYVVHDLKNILAQQSLIVSNAEKHKSNPKFVDDMISTVENSVKRMTRLMEQMRSGLRTQNPQQLSVKTLLENCIGRQRQALPVPQLLAVDEQATVFGDAEQLSTVICHLIQNAQEATDDEGSIEVTASREGDEVVIEVTDTGCGMTEEFISERLFRAFDSTKGLTGMGIGAYESREVVRGLGGNIFVSSAPGEGSTFRLVLPCADMAKQRVAGEQ